MNARPVRGPAGADAVAHVFVAALDDRCEISGDDGRHLQRVRRLTAGEIVTAADDSGAWREYEVSAVLRDALVLDARAPAQFAPDPGPGVSLAVALTKGGLEDIVAATTALGVERIMPLRMERVVVRWDDARAARGVARLRAVAREAAMQSRRARIPIVDDVAGLTTLRDRRGLVVAGVDGVRAWELPSPGGASERVGWTAVVGPEGGLGANELAAFEAVPRLWLSPNVLRAVHAPVAAVAVLAQEAERRRSPGSLAG